MNTKQQQLLFDKGITNVPSDALCSDNALSESIGLVYDDGEHRVIQKPKEFITSAVSAQSTITISGLPQIMYVHKFNDEERYIGHMTITAYHQDPVDAVVWGTVNNKVFTMQGGLSLAYQSGFKFSSIGKTLIVTSDTLVPHYYVWKNDVYVHYDSLPMPRINFWLSYYTWIDGNLAKKHYKVTDTASAEGILDIGGGSSLPTIENQEKYNDYILGLYFKNKKEICRLKSFCNPFYVRAALELYDGSYYHITNPVLLFPSVTRNTMAGTGGDGLIVETHCAQLFCTQETDYSDFSDIIKGVELFVTDEIDLYDTVSDQEIGLLSDTYSIDKLVNISGTSSYSTISGTSADLRVLKEKEHIDIKKDLESTHSFYHLCGIGIKPVTNLCLCDKIDPHTLENITTQEYLEHDDFYSMCPIYPKFQFSYNSRLNLANVRRGFFEGFDDFMPYDNSGSNTYFIYVTIQGDYQEFTIRHQLSTKQKQGIYFFYPDSRAKHVKIFKTDGTTTWKILDENLIEHPILNGAYFFKGLPGADENEPTGSVYTGDLPSFNNNDTEDLSNYILTSEPNNPWVFTSFGYYSVGTGKIIGMSSITQALSEGQFGQFPLLVFSESGIWALSVADTGYYSSIHPMSREVCNNSKSITQTDGAVFFTSEKGLMVVVGNQVKCVSDQLSGRYNPSVEALSMGDFQSFFKHCYIAYDYRDSLLWIMGNSNAPVASLIYSIKTGIFSKYQWASPTTGTVNNYPDSLIQTYDGKVYSLLERPNINSDTYPITIGQVTYQNHNQYSATMISRPMKFENALALKSIMQVKHIKQFIDYTMKDSAGHDVPFKGSITFRLFASNNLENWVELSSLRGTPWKYYRFRLDFANLIATDRYAGTMLITQERRTDKLR